MKYILGVVLLMIGTVSLLPAQSTERGLPFIHNFTPKQYHAYTQNWAVVQDHRGVMYFGNNKGVLEYDGINWQLFPVSNHSIVRSLAIDSTGTIFVGAVGEFGYMAPDKTGKLTFHSLTHKIKNPALSFSDVWSTLVKGDEVYFQSFDVLFRYKNGEIKDWPLKNAYHRSFVVHDKLYIREEGRGLMTLEGDSLREVKGGSLFAWEVVSAMLPYQDQILIGSRNKGLFLLDPEKGKIEPFSSDVNQFLAQNQLYHGALLSDGSFAFGTIKGGVMVIDQQGKFVIQLNQQAGLETRTAYFLYQDREGALWLGLNHGISKIEIISRIQVFDKMLNLDSGILGITRFQGSLYVCTQQGVFYLDSNNHFKQIEGIYSQAWQFEKFKVPAEPAEEKLLVASTYGIYEVYKDSIHLIYAGRGGSVTTSVSNPSRIFAGFHGYLMSFRYEAGAWIEEGRLDNIGDEFRSLKEDASGNLWMGSMFKGTYRLRIEDWEDYIAGKNIDISGAVKHYTASDGQPTANWNNFFRVNNEVLLATQKGIYRHNKEKDLFEKDQTIDQALDGENRWFYYLNEDKNGNLWFDSDKGKGTLLKENAGYSLSENAFKRIIVSPENQVGGFVDEDGVSWFGTPDGLYRYNGQAVSSFDEPFYALIRKVMVQDSTVFNGTFFNEKAGASASSYKTSLDQPASLKQALPYSNNSLSFHYSAPVYRSESSNRYSYFLEGYDKGWSPWNRESKKEYTNLPEGKYTFRVRARDFTEKVSGEATYEFSVLPPWYRTSFAYAGYLILLFGGVGLITRSYSTRLKKDNQRLEALVQNRTAKIEAQKNQIEKSYQNVTTLSLIGQQITATLNFNNIIEISYKSVNTLLPNVSSFGVGIYNGQTQSIDFQYSYEEGKALSFNSQKLSDRTKLSAWCFNNCKEVFINDLQQEYTRYLSDLSKTPTAGRKHSKSIMYVPLQVQEKTIGVITVQSFDKGAYQPYHLDILRTLGAYTAIALDNSYAYLRLNEINKALSTTLEDLKQTQTQLVQSEKMASLGQLTAGVAHEINNPINFVSAGIDSLAANYDDLNELLEKYTALKPGQDNTCLLEELEGLKEALELDNLLEEIPQLLNSIKCGARRTTEIVKSLRNFTRLDEENMKSADIHEGLDSTLVILRSQLGERVKVERYYGQLPSLQCYPGQLNQVFMNIMSNAIQAIEGEGRLSIETSLQQNEVLISIRDTGAGMDEVVKQRIFEPFFTTKAVGEGTGLGLSISYGIIKKHKGNIEVISTAGEGTEFRIHLPTNLS